MFGFGKKNKPVRLKRLPRSSISKKSCGDVLCDYPRDSLYMTLTNKNNGDLAAYLSLNYYVGCDSFYNGVDIIASEESTISPAVQNKKTKEFIFDHPILDLFDKVNPISSFESFMTSLGVFYLVTGNVFIVSSFLSNGLPAELFVMHPQSVEIIVGNDGYIQRYEVNEKSGRTTFNRVSNVTDDIFRYKDAIGREIYQIKSFNPFINSQWGLSIVNPAFYALEQCMNAGLHNLSLLKNGARLSGVFTTEQELDDEHFDRLKEESKTFYEGSGNAGATGVFDGGVEFKELGMTNKDMDYKTLVKNIDTKIYNLLRIPLPIISETSMTMANMEAAKLNLYDNAVLPLTRRLYAELTRFLMPYYKNSDDLEVSFDEGEILALEPRRNEELEKLSGLNVLTTNEVRKIIGYEPVENGDDVLILNNMMLLGSSAEQDNQKSIDCSAYYTSRGKFISIMKSKKDKNGKQLFNDEKINEIADQNDLK